MYEDGSQIDGVRAGKAHHIAWQPPAGAAGAGTLLILDASRHLFGLTNGDLRAVPLRGVEQWRADTAMAITGETEEAEMAKTQYTKTVEQTEDQILAMVGQAQAAVIDAVSTVSERVAGFLPEIPELPYAEQVPSPAEFVRLWTCSA